MMLHKIQTGPERIAHPASLGVHLNVDMWEVANNLVRARAAQQCEIDLRRLPIYRQVRFSVSRKSGDLFDAFALDAEFESLRVDKAVVLLTAPGVFVSGTGYEKADYTSCSFELWAESVARAAEAKAHLRRIAGPVRKGEQKFVIDWHFRDAGGRVRSSSFEEAAPEALLDEAYPALGQGVEAFIAAYLAAPDSVLILLGPPGGGKTKLVRAILAALTRRKRENATVMYTTDKRALESDEMFVDFITGAHDAFVVEDTDHLLRPRTSGNDEMHRFLSIADGIARGQGRKILFTTNLPNVSDIDPALIRPGRCYAVCNLRSLTPEEAVALAKKLCGDDAEKLAHATSQLEATGGKSRSVAQVYRACS